MDQYFMEAVGVVAGCCTTGSFLPQAWRTFRTKSVGDISLAMYAVLCLGVALWIAYGLMIGSFAVLAANCVTLVLAGSVLLMKIVYGRTAPDEKKAAPAAGTAPGTTPGTAVGTAAGPEDGRG